MNDDLLSCFGSAPTKETTTSPAKHMPTMVIDKPGIYTITNELYHMDPCIEPSLSRGVIDDLLNLTPAHAKQNHPRLGGDDSEETDAEETVEKFNVGSAAHSLFLEGLDIAEVIDPADYPGAKGGIPKGWTTDSIRKARDDARLAGKIPFLPKQYKKVQDMVKAAHIQLAASELAIKDLHGQGDAEKSYFWQEPSGAWCRVRPDWISHKNLGGDRKIVIGYKTTGISADPVRFKQLDHAKNIEWAFYRRGVKAVEGGKAPRYIFMVQETAPPYLCSFVSLDPQSQEMANQMTDYGIFLWEKCLTMDDWPGYPLRIAYAELKPWDLAAWEARSQEIGCE